MNYFSAFVVAEETSWSPYGRVSLFQDFLYFFFGGRIRLARLLAFCVRLLIFPLRNKES